MDVDFAVSCQDWDLSPGGFFAVRLWTVLTRWPGLVTTAHVERPPFHRGGSV